MLRSGLAACLVLLTFMALLPAGPVHALPSMVSPALSASTSSLLRVEANRAAPGGLVARAEGPAVIVLSWRAPYAGESARFGYRIEVSEEGAGWSELVPETGTPDTVYRHSGLEGGTTNRYRVSAVFESRTGPPSGVAMATTPPNPPAGLRVTTGERRVTLDWRPPTHGGGAAILRYEYAVNGGEWRSAGSALTATVTNLVNGPSHAFAVRAVNTGGPGEPARHVTGAIEERLRGGSPGVVPGGRKLHTDEDASASGGPWAEVSAREVASGRAKPDLSGATRNSATISSTRRRTSTASKA